MTLDLLPNHTFAAMLFDMDGTILNSISAAENVWSAWAARQGLDVEHFLPTIHGRRAIDTIARLNLPGVDPISEAAGITAAEIAEVNGINEIPGAADFLNSIPISRWAVVTSAPRKLAQSRLNAAGLPTPQVLITAEDVTNGKPDPECYLLAAQQLGVNIAECLIFEDADIGIRAARASGGTLVIVTSTHIDTNAEQRLSIRDFIRCRQTLLGKLK